MFWFDTHLIGMKEIFFIFLINSPAALALIVTMNMFCFWDINLRFHLFVDAGLGIYFKLGPRRLGSFSFLDSRAKTMNLMSKIYNYWAFDPVAKTLH